MLELSHEFSWKQEAKDDVKVTSPEFRKNFTFISLYKYFNYFNCTKKILFNSNLE